MGNDFGSAIGGFLSSFGNGYMSGSQLALKQREMEIMEGYRQAQMEELAMKRELQKDTLDRSRAFRQEMNNVLGYGQSPSAQQSQVAASPSNPAIAPSNEYTIPDTPAQKNLQIQAGSVDGYTPDIQGTKTIPGFVTGANTDKLIPEFNNRMQGMAQAYLAATGEPLRLTDTYRTYDQQVDVRNRKGNWAATPGTSMHGYGGAVDADPVQLAKADKLGLLSLYGLDRPFKDRAVRPEPWHMEPSGLNKSMLTSSGNSGVNPGSSYEAALPKMVATQRDSTSQPSTIAPTSASVNQKKQKVEQLMYLHSLAIKHGMDKEADNFKNAIEMLVKDIRDPQEKMNDELALSKSKAEMESTIRGQELRRDAGFKSGMEVSTDLAKKNNTYETYVDPKTGQYVNVPYGSAPPAGYTKTYSPEDINKAPTTEGLSRNQMIDQHGKLSASLDAARRGMTIINGVETPISKADAMSIVKEVEPVLKKHETTMYDNGIQNFPFRVFNPADRETAPKLSGSHSTQSAQKEQSPKSQLDLSKPDVMDSTAQYMAGQYAGTYKTKEQIDAMYNQHSSMTSDPQKIQLAKKVRDYLYKINKIPSVVDPTQYGSL